MQEVFLIHQRHLQEPLKDQGLSVHFFNSQDEAIQKLAAQSAIGNPMPAAILCEFTMNGSYKELISFTKTLTPEVPVIVLSKLNNDLVKKDTFTSGAADCFFYELDMKKLAFRIRSLDNWKKPVTRKPVTLNYKMPVLKRIFDLTVASGLLLALLPLFIVIALIIKFTSRGPVFYSSPRVGTGYKVFPFYKFRSMRVDADKMLEDLKHLNHYKTSIKIEEEITFDTEGPMLIGDEGYISEDNHLQKQLEENKQAFVKFNNDPRITRIGHFIRKTSIDELPQLFNVLLGHMSIVGNRPLPLYEAEKLTSDEWSMRFMAPAGITGLWQVTERGKAATSEDSRKKLDVLYAKKYSMWMDIKILIKTPFAAIQQEKV